MREVVLIKSPIASGWKTIEIDTSKMLLGNRLGSERSFLSCERVYFFNINPILNLRRTSDLFIYKVSSSSSDASEMS